MENQVMITTEDNPYNPFIEFDKWLAYDMQMGYKTCEQVASIALISDQLSDEENSEEIEKVFNSMIHTGAISKTGKLVNYKKVYRDSKTITEETSK